MLLNSDSTASKSVLKRQVLVGKKRFIQLASILGRRQTPFQKPTWQWKFLNGEKEVKHSRGRRGEVQSLHYPPLCADFLLISCWWGNRSLMLRLTLPSSIWVGALVPAEKLKDSVMHIPWGGTRALTHHCATVSWLRLRCILIPFVVVN